MMKKPIKKTPFYRDRSFLFGFVFTMVIVVGFFFLVARPARMKDQQELTPQPNQQGQASLYRAAWRLAKPELPLSRPGGFPSDLLRVGDEVWIFTDEGKKLAKLDLNGEMRSEVVLEFLCSKAAWDGESVWCTDMSSSVAQMDAATGKVLVKFDTETEIIQSIAWDGERPVADDPSGFIGEL